MANEIKQKAAQDIVSAWNRVAGISGVIDQGQPKMQDFYNDLEVTRVALVKQMLAKTVNDGLISQLAAAEGSKRAVAMTMLHKKYELSRTDKIRSGINTAKEIVNNKGLLTMLLKDSK